MDKELGQFCSNCKKNVAAANYITHSAFCWRNIKICEVCDKPIPKNSIKEHEKEHHISVKYEKCNASVKKWEMPKHQSEYGQHSKSCVMENYFRNYPRCNENIPPFVSKDHSYKTCRTLNDSRIQVSESESMSVSRPQTSYGHFMGMPVRISRSNHAIRAELTKNDQAMVCPFCKKQLHLHVIREHIDSCSEKYFQCDFCCEQVLQEDRGKHLTFQCKMLQDLSSDLYEYPLCGEQMLEKDKSARESLACRALLQDNGPLYSLWNEKASKNYAKETKKNSTEAYMKCKEKIPVNDLPNREQSCNTRKICVYCDKELHVDDSEALHLRVCEVYKHFRTHSSKSVSMSVSRPQTSYAFHDELTENDQAMVCPFCKKQLHLHVIQAHIDSCSAKYFQCDLCCEQVLQEDRDKHLAFQCKMLQDLSSDLYECPLCGEQMLEKDKSAHESLACRTLLQDDGPLYSGCSRVPPKTHHGSTSVGRLQCIICIHKERDTVFQPCGHLIVCNNCAENVKSTCPMCREHINKKIRAYIN